MQRMFNVREGFLREHDQLPERVLKLPEFDKYKNVNACAIDDIDEMLNQYYDTRGWDKTSGIPTNVKFEELGL